MIIYPQYFQLKKKYKVPNPQTQYNLYENSRYEGAMRDKVREGWGKLMVSNTDYYEGQFKNNKLNGFGVHIKNEQTFYIGDFLNG